MTSAAITRNWHYRKCHLFWAALLTSADILWDIKKKTVEEFKPNPYLATVLKYAFWVLYGMPFVHPNSILVITINSVGLVFEFIYLIIFLIYSTNKGRKKVSLSLLAEAVFFATIVLITILALHGTVKRSLIVGVLCDVFNVIMYVAPLTIMAKVIKSKSVKYMPFWLSLANFLNGVCWTTYALIQPFDIYVLIGNGLGAISGLVQLILYACYYKQTLVDNDASQPNNEVQLSAINASNNV